MPILKSQLLPKNISLLQHKAYSLARLIPNIRRSLNNVCCMYRIYKCDGSHQYLNKSVQVYQDTDYPRRDGLRTEPFPNTSHSQRAVTVTPCMSYVTGQVVEVPAPLELTSTPSHLPRQQVLSGCSRDSSTYTL